MKLRQLEIFVHVADPRSFSKAAKQLYLTQPTVSAQIAALEKELQLQMLESDSAEVIHEVETHIADIGFVGTVPENRQCMALPLFPVWRWTKNCVRDRYWNFRSQTGSPWRTKRDGISI